MDNKLFYLIAIFLGVALIVFSITSLSNNKNDNELINTLKIKGESKITIMPNEAYIYFTIESTDLNAVISKNNVDTTWENIKTKLDAKKITYETDNYSVQPNYVWNEISRKSELKGYTTRHSLTITLDDLEEVNSTIDSIVINNYTNINSIAFGISDEEESKLKAQLWSLAITDAQNTVKEISSENNIKIKSNPIAIVESGNYYRPYYSMAYDSVTSMEAKADIAPKEQEVNLTLELTFELE
jgi:uncharacterized protein YggE